MADPTRFPPRPGPMLAQPVLAPQMPPHQPGPPMVSAAAAAPPPQAMPPRPTYVLPPTQGQPHLGVNFGGQPMRVPMQVPTHQYPGGQPQMVLPGVQSSWPPSTNGTMPVLPHLANGGAAGLNMRGASAPSMQGAGLHQQPADGSDSLAGISGLDRMLNAEAFGGALSATGGLAFGTAFGGPSLQQAFPGGFPGAVPGGFPGGFPGVAGGAPRPAVAAPAPQKRPAPSAPSPTARKKKPTSNGEAMPTGSGREDFVYDFPGMQKGSSSRANKTYQPSAATLAKRQAKEEEQLRRQEKAEEQKRQREAEKERKRAAEDAERAFWAVPDGFEMTVERRAMQKILQELFDKKHRPASEPFVAESDGAGGALVKPNLWDVHEDFKAGKIGDMADFAASVRNVFYKCYYTYGLPDVHTLSKACEKVDLVFEQQIVLLPRSLREQAVMPQPQREDEGLMTEDGDEVRRSARARVSVQMLTTLQMVELEKRRRRGEEEKEKREERERERLAAEAWATQAVPEAQLRRVQSSFDGVTVAYFCLRHAEALGLPGFSLPEFEAALACFPAHSALLRLTVMALLRLTRPSSSRKAAAAAEPPRRSAVAAALADRLVLWKAKLEEVTRAEEGGVDVAHEEAQAFLEDGEVQELLVGLGDLAELEQTLRTEGLAAVEVETLARLLHALIEHGLKVDKHLAASVDDDEGKVRCLGRDSSGEVYFYFGALHGRLCVMSDKRLPTSRHEPCARGAVGAVVQPGETIEVEVEEGGVVEWRAAQVRKVLRGSTGRFTACVLFPPDEEGAIYPDEDFVECYNAAQKDKEWRKMRTKAEIAREKREAAAATAAAARESAGEKLPPDKARQCGRFREQPAAKPAAKAAAPAAPAKAAPKGKAKAVFVPPRPAHELVGQATQSFRELAIPALLKQLKPSKDRLDRRLLELVREIADGGEDTSAAQARGWSAAMMRLHRDVHAPEPPEPPAPAPDDAAAEDAAADSDEPSPEEAAPAKGAQSSSAAAPPAKPAGRATGGWRARVAAEEAAAEAAEAAEAVAAAEAAEAAEAAAAAVAAAAGAMAQQRAAQGVPGDGPSAMEVDGR